MSVSVLCVQLRCVLREVLVLIQARPSVYLLCVCVLCCVLCVLCVVCCVCKPEVYFAGDSSFDPSTALVVCVFMLCLCVLCELT